MPDSDFRREPAQQLRVDSVHASLLCYAMLKAAGASSPSPPRRDPADYWAGEPRW